MFDKYTLFFNTLSFKGSYCRVVDIFYSFITCLVHYDVQIFKKKQTIILKLAPWKYWDVCLCVRIALICAYSCDNDVSIVIIKTMLTA